jgi:hypothetical protein
MPQLSEEQARAGGDAVMNEMVRSVRVLTQDELQMVTQLQLDSVKDPRAIPNRESILDGLKKIRDYAAANSVHDVAQRLSALLRTVQPTHD